jgi:NO-binding membrane sensor protein with MHYT domain
MMPADSLVAIIGSIMALTLANRALRARRISSRTWVGMAAAWLLVIAVVAAIASRWQN